MLKQRILTALVLAPLVLWALFGLTDNLLSLFIGLILLAGANEWTKLAEIKSRQVQLLFLFAVCALLCLCLWLVTFSPATILIILVSAVLLWFVILFWLVLYERGQISIHLSQGIRILLGLLLLSLCFIGIISIVYHFRHDRASILLLFMLIWGADIAAYFTGRTWGKTKLAPKISPGKSWQGVVGALLMTTILASLAWYLMNYPLELLPKMVLFSLLVVIVSIAGDLFESVLKRQVGIKDSGSLLPGHGGVLDRIDSLIAASPVYALGIYLLGVG